MADKVTPDTAPENTTPASIPSANLDAVPIHRAASEAALDKLLAEAPAGEDDSQNQPGDAGGDQPAAAAVDKSPGDSKPAGTDASGAAAGAAAGDGTSASGAPAAGASPAGDSAQAQPAAATTTPEPDEFDAVKLPPYTKEKAAAAFAQVKEMARTRIAAIQKKLTEQEAALSKAQKESEEKLKAVSAETEDLRKWRKSVEVESDPSFKEYDAKVDRNLNNIFSKLTEAGLAEADVAKIKELRGNIVWDDIWTHLENNKEVAAKLKIPANTLRRYVEARLLDNENIADQKKEALTKAKAEADTFLNEREARTKKQQEEAKNATLAHADQLLQELPWARKQTVPADAKPEDKARLEALNQFAQETQERVAKVLTEDTPQVRAELAVGTAMAYYFKAQFDFTKKQLDDAQAKLTAAQSELDRIKKASGASRNISQAPPRPNSQRNTSILKPAADALDEIRDQVLAAQA